MKDQNNINEYELDELLRSLYLEEHSNVSNEKEAQFIMEQHYPVNIDPAKEQVLLKRLQRKPHTFGGFKFYFLLFILVGVIIFFAIYFYSKAHHTISHNSNRSPNVVTLDDTKQTNSSVTDGNNFTSINGTNNSIKVVDTFGRPKTINATVIRDSVSINSQATPIPANIKTEKTAPYLTEKDKVRYTKVKSQMLLNLIQSNKNLYTHIEANKLVYANKKIIVDAFTIRNVGITNLEYKTFLADLLIQKRNEEYLIADVCAEKWAKYGYTHLENTYFQDEIYNDFPVVNISHEGAKLFCKWLEEEINLYTQQHHLKIKPLKIRLPCDEEWIYAAREGYAKIAFENGYNTIYDNSEGLVDKSFANRAELVKKRVKRIDTLYTVFTTNKYGWSENKLTEFLNSGFKYYSSQPTDTIYTDRMKVFGKIGRVSEMVTQRNTSRIWLSGLSWKNKKEYLKLENEFKTDISSPFVGFRLVVINTTDPEYKNPFW